MATDRSTPNKSAEKKNYSTSDLGSVDEVFLDNPRAKVTGYSKPSPIADIDEKDFDISLTVMELDRYYCLHLIWELIVNMKNPSNPDPSFEEKAVDSLGT